MGWKGTTLASTLGVVCVVAASSVGCDAVFGIRDGLVAAGDASTGGGRPSVRSPDGAVPPADDEEASTQPPDTTRDSSMGDDGGAPLESGIPDGASCVAGGSCQAGQCQTGQFFCSDAGVSTCQSISMMTHQEACRLSTGDPGACLAGVCQPQLTFNGVAYGAATQTVSSSPGGVSCSVGAQACTATQAYASGSTVVLSLGGGGTGQYHWGGACSGTGSTCTVTMSGTQTVTLTLNANNYAFVTSNNFDANMGGLAGADKICNTAAQGGGLPGTYVAMLSTSTVAAKTRLGSARGWIRTDGLPIADTPQSLFTDDKMYYPIGTTELGTAAQRFDDPFTGSGNDGTYATISGPPSTCNDWTSDNAALSAACGSISFASDGWLGSCGGECDGHYPVFCFETDLTTPLTVPKASGRLAFLSATTWDTSTGLAAADTLCQNEAGSAGLTGASSFIALLGTSKASDTSRLNAAGSNWVRTDGIPIASSTSTFLTGSWDAPIAVQADGVTYPPISADSPEIMLGGYLGGSMGDLTFTCNDWTSDSASDTGVSGVLDTNSTDLVDGTDTQPCGSYLIYCIQP